MNLFAIKAKYFFMRNVYHPSYMYYIFSMITNNQTPIKPKELADKLYNWLYVHVLSGLLKKTWFPSSFYLL